jgi:hypothetical protein
MANDKAATRHWQQIAEEMRKEKDSKRREELIRELEKSFKEDGRERRPLRINGRLILPARSISPSM